MENILSAFKSRFVYMSYEDHDLVTANTQAVTHAAFLRLSFIRELLAPILRLLIAWGPPGQVCYLTLGGRTATT